MNKVNSYVIVGCPALTFASPVGTNSILVQPIGDRFAPIEENWKPVGDRNKPIGDGGHPLVIRTDRLATNLVGVKRSPTKLTMVEEKSK